MRVAIPNRRCLVALVLLAAGTIVGCASEESGVPPPRDEFYFPTGVAVDPTRPLLYVTNSNADLRHNGGTITALDLSRIPIDLGAVGQQIGGGSGRACEEGSSDACPAGESCSAAGRCVELDCRPDRIDPSRWECPEGQFIIESATTRIGDFPSELRLNADGTRIFAPVRGQNYLAWIDIAALSDDECQRRYGRSGCVDLRCDDAPDSGCAGVGARDCPVWDCDDRHQVNFSERRQDTLPAEPFGVHWNRLAAVHVDADGTRRTCHDGLSEVSCDCGSAQPCVGDDAVSCCEPAPELNHLYVAHLSGGDVSYFASTPDAVELRDFTGGFFNPESGIRGGFSLAPALAGDPRGRTYVSSRVENIIASFTIRDNQQIIRTRRLSVGAIDPGTDVRGIAFGPGGKVLYSINRAPPSLTALDMTEAGERDLGEALWTAEVCGDPSVLRLGASHLHPGVAEARLAYVVCFGEAQVYVVDTVTGAVVGRIVTGEGPNALELDDANKRAFIANFAENTVGIIDLDPGRETYLKMVLRLGLARAPERD